MATRKKIVLRRQRRSALNRRKRQTGKRIYRRKVMRGGVSYKDVGLALTVLPDIKTQLTEKGIHLDKEEQITAESIKTDIVPIIQGQIKKNILENIPKEEDKITAVELLDSLFNIITNPPSDIAAAKNQIDELLTKIQKFLPFTAMAFYYLIKQLLPKLLDLVAAAAPAAPAASPAASGGGTAPASAAAYNLDLS
jgi:hypothetical protein